MLVNMNDVLHPARAGGYGVGFFNALNVEMARAVIETAEELRAPVMIGTAEILLPMTPLERVAEYLLPMAEKASVPVCVHFDHALRFETCMQAMRLGFTSVMYDCSTLGYAENQEQVAQVVRVAHGMGVTVEGELGHVGDNEGAGRLDDPSAYFTDPAEARMFVESTGVDALAVAVGNAHGEYPFAPKLDFMRIEQLAASTGVPLVLHGGSGLSDDDFRMAIARGVHKVNIFTDLDKAGAAGCRKAMDQGIYKMSEMIPLAVEEMKHTVKRLMYLFGSDGKA